MCVIFGLTKNTVNSHKLCFNVLQLISLFVIHDLIKSDFCLYFQLPLDNYRN